MRELVAGSLALAVEDVAPDALGDGHAHVDIEPDARDPHAGVFLVLGEEERVVVRVVVVPVAAVAASLIRGHDARKVVSWPVGSRGPVEQ